MTNNNPTNTPLTDALENETTCAYQAWRNRLNEILNEAGICLERVAPANYRLKDLGTNTILASRIDLTHEDLSVIQLNLIRRALANAQRDTPRHTNTRHDETGQDERQWQKHVENEMGELEYGLGYLEGRLHGKPRENRKHISIIYGIMRGETKPSAFYAITEPAHTAQGITYERHLLETHDMNEALAWFGIEADK